jgi:hypothetical protein
MLMILGWWFNFWCHHFHNPQSLPDPQDNRIDLHNRHIRRRTLQIRPLSLHPLPVPLLRRCRPIRLLISQPPNSQPRWGRTEGSSRHIRHPHSTGCQGSRLHSQTLQTYQRDSAKAMAGNGAVHSYTGEVFFVFEVV